MDLASIKAAYTSAKFVKDALNTVLDYKIDQESKDKINEILERVGPIQDTLFELREELFRLQDKNRELEAQLQEINNWEERKNSFKLKKTIGGAVVYLSNTEPPYFVCPSCTEKNEIHPLQPEGEYSGNYQCPGCDKNFPVDKPKPIPSTVGDYYV